MWWRDQKLKTLVERTLVMDRFYQSLPGEAHASSQKKQTLTIIGTHCQMTRLLGGARQTRLELPTSSF